MTKPTVILTHGVFLKPPIMYLMATRLRRAGFECKTFGYKFSPPALSTLAAELAAVAAEDDQQEVLMVGHSLGGILSLMAAALLPSRKGKIVALGSPFLGSAVGRKVASYKLGRLAFGGSAPAWEPGAKFNIPAGWSCGVIAGTREFGVSKLLRVELARPNDGTVAADETKLPGLSDWKAISASHTLLPLSITASRQAIAFLKNGKFE